MSITGCVSEVTVIFNSSFPICSVNVRLPQKRKCCCAWGFAQDRGGREDFRGKQTISHHCSELQAGQVFPTIKVADFPLRFTFLTISVPYDYLISIQNWTEMIFCSWYKIRNDHCKETILAPWTWEVMWVPRDRAELSSSAGTHRESSWCTVMLTLNLKILSGKLLLHGKKRGKGEEGVGF